MKPEFTRKVVRNSTNKKVEKNVVEIVQRLLSMGLSRADIAKYAGVSQGAVSVWENRGRADARIIDKLIDSVSRGQELNEMDSTEREDGLSALKRHISGLQRLGFDVHLIPRND